MHGGEVFVPKIPSTTIVDLAKAIAPDCEIEIIGIRPGEKLHELLISEDEARSTIELDDMFVVLPASPQWFVHDWEKEGKKLEDGYSYASNTNTEWMDLEQIKEIVKPIEQAYLDGTLK
jgi:UDP-N-acetylglucosamine 4,6-dehydratase